MKGLRMCPNESCEHRGKPTKLAGGCDCGTALVAYRDGMEPSMEPTNEQLGHLVFLFSMQTPEVGLVDPKMAPRIFDDQPELRETWLERHRELQAALKRGSSRPVGQVNG